jgi:glycosyltransferase involved in cell wall biosynthesis
VKGLVLRGHEVEVITAFPHYPLGNIPTQYRYQLITIESGSGYRMIRVWLPGIPHQGFSRRLLMYLLFSITALFGLPIVKRPDVIWAASPSVFSSLPATIYSLVNRAPVVRNVDDLWPETTLQLGVLNSKLTRFGEALAKLSYLLSKALTPISRAYCKLLTKKYEVPGSKLHVAEVGVDIGAFSIQTVDEASKNDKFTVIYSGLLGVGYDFEVVLQAAKQLQNNKVHILIHGTGEMEEWVRNEVIKQNLNNVTISSVFLEHTELIELLTSADAFLLPMKPHKSSDMGVPTKLLEYMACGRPVICSSAGESARIVEKAKCGIVVPPGDALALAGAISELAESRSRMKMGLNGRTFAEEHYALEKIAIKLERAFQHAISN